MKQQLLLFEEENLRYAIAYLDGHTVTKTGVVRKGDRIVPLKYSQRGKNKNYYFIANGRKVSLAKVMVSTFAPQGLDRIILKDGDYTNYGLDNIIFCDEFYSQIPFDNYLYQGKIYYKNFSLDYKKFFVAKDGEILNLATHNILKPCGHGRGYLIFKFDIKKGKPIGISHHRLVWETFNKRKVPSNMTINHIDGNKKNNQLSNLEVCSYAENTHHAVVNNLIKTKYSSNDILITNQLVEQGLSNKEIIAILKEQKKEDKENGIVDFVNRVRKKKTFFINHVLESVNAN
jgi:hypothetical protein